MADMTRPLNRGPYQHVPGAAPPLHATAADPADDARDVSRVSGMDTDPLVQADGPVGVTGSDGQPVGYAGKDVTEPQTWGERAYNEAPGMFGRLQQEAQAGG